MLYARKSQHSARFLMASCDQDVFAMTTMVDDAPAVAVLSFPSLNALREASDRLILRLANNDDASVDSDSRTLEQITDFIKSAVATGAVLDAPPDRRAAQAIIDFWLGKRDSVGGESPSRRRRSMGSDSTLRSFDRETIKIAIDKGNEVLESLSPRAKDLARRILFQVLVLPDDGDDYDSAPQSRADLCKLGKPQNVDNLLNRLCAARILTEVDGRVGLTYSAFTREWGWLKKELEERMKLRALAVSWERSGRANDALLGWPSTWKYRSYTNLDARELDFLARSGRYGAFWFAGVITALLIVGGVTLYGPEYYTVNEAPKQAPSVIAETVAPDTNFARKVSNIKWLGVNRLSVDIPSIELAGREDDQIDLKGLFAPNANFQQSLLKFVDFTDANLESARFNGSVIWQSKFQNARLLRATFDDSDFCGRLDFTQADVRFVSLKRAKFTDLPKFDNTPWWQISGLTLEEIATLSRERPADQIDKTNQFKRILDAIDSRVKATSDLKEPERRARPLNEKAWTLALYGSNLDEAEKSGRKALLLIQNGTDKELTALVEDTLAYILLQRGEASRYEEALRLLTDAVTKVSSDSSVVFRYAVALHATGKTADALKNLETALITSDRGRKSPKYQPTHELYLLRTLLERDGFGKDIARMLTETGGNAPRKAPDEGACALRATPK
jgi:uncharacterized protein YjbI with pentapeptide repeats